MTVATTATTLSCESPRVLTSDTNTSRMIHDSFDTISILSEGHSELAALPLRGEEEYPARSGEVTVVSNFELSQIGLFFPLFTSKILVSSGRKPCDDDIQERKPIDSSFSLLSSSRRSHSLLRIESKRFNEELRELFAKATRGEKRLFPSQGATKKKAQELKKSRSDTCANHHFDPDELRALSAMKTFL